MKNELPRTLGAFDALSIVVGIVIGGGIFLVPNLVAQNVRSTAAILGVWIFAGIISFFGALGCAELGAAIPDTGGQYVFLREAYGPLVGFLCGWTMFVVVRTAQVAWLAVTFSLYLSYFHPLGPVTSKLVGMGAIGAFTAINYRGATAGAKVQNTFTLAKVAGILIIIGGAFLAGHHGPPPATVIAPFSYTSFGVALIFCLLAYDGWVQVSFVAGEVRNPQRNMLIALAFGVASVIAIYVLANGAYLRVLSIPQIAASNHVGADAAETALGPAGGALVSIIILLSICGTLNGCFLTSPRIYFAQARDGLFFSRFATVHPRYSTPAFAILAQGAWAGVLLLSGSYESLADYAMFATWVFYGLMITGVIILRRKRPDLARPYRMWGYPVTPALFLIATLWFLGNTLVSRPVPALAGLAFIVVGIPAYYIWGRRRRLAAVA